MPLIFAGVFSMRPPPAFTEMAGLPGAAGNTPASFSSCGASGPDTVLSLPPAAPNAPPGARIRFAAPGGDARERPDVRAAPGEALHPPADAGGELPRLAVGAGVKAKRACLRRDRLARAVERSSRPHPEGGRPRAGGEPVAGMALSPVKEPAGVREKVLGVPRKASPFPHEGCPPA
jgi:predicted small lipoprotein YifL